MRTILALAVFLSSSISYASCGYTTDAYGNQKYSCTDDDQYPRYNAPDTGLFSNGYECTVDCSGHNAGNDWAQRNGITDPSDCMGNSLSFVEGCRSATR